MLDRPWESEGRTLCPPPAAVSESGESQHHSAKGILSPVLPILTSSTLLISLHQRLQMSNEPRLSVSSVGELAVARISDLVCPCLGAGYITDHAQGTKAVPPAVLQTLSELLLDAIGCSTPPPDNPGGRQSSCRPRGLARRGTALTRPTLSWRVIADRRLSYSTQSAATSGP